MVKTNKTTGKQLSERDYCIDKIREIEEFLPSNYSDLVNVIAIKKGMEPFPESRIRNVKTFKTYDKAIADLLYKIGYSFRALTND